MRYDFLLRGRLFHMRVLDGIGHWFDGWRTEIRIHVSKGSRFFRVPIGIEIVLVNGAFTIGMIEGRQRHTGA